MPPRFFGLIVDAVPSPHSRGAEKRRGRRLYDEDKNYSEHGVMRVL
jgi:hypothetical protein